MKQIGIIGYKGSGKSTAAEIIMEAVKPHTSSHINFADALKLEIARMYNCTVQYINEHKDNFQLILQGHDTDYRRKLYSDNYWLERYLRKCLEVDSSYIVTSDVRIENEASLIKDMGGVLVRINRNLNVDSHISETGIDKLQYDFTLDNTGSLEQLRNQVNDLMRRIK